VHLTSSIAVHGLKEGGNGGKAREGAPATDVEHLTGGYGQSRWISEKIFTGGSEKGVPANVYRPGIIIGDSRTGIVSAEDLVWRIVRTSIEFGIGPMAEAELYLTPVDYVSRALVYLSRKTENLGKVYHLVSPARKTLLDILEFSISIGYRIKLVPPWQWEREIASRAGGDHPFRPYFSLSPQSLKKNILDFAAYPALGTDNAVGDLAGSGIVGSGVSEEFLGRCFDYLVGEGYLKRPGSAAPNRSVKG
jgi:thioester reductase-like protein